MSDSTYIVKVGTWKEGVVIRTCLQQDGEGVCMDTSANTTSELDKKKSNFTILMGNTSLISGAFKGKKKQKKKQKNKNTHYKKQ